ncbi:ATPase [Paenibacillus dendritiformis]|uniref:AAA family ATPase n=1 Tax=Paenibacillus dendritiformis TaxID=130049 RepID=UPI00105A5F91|nr:AAA family ATPase [Paenibacillus dendritiformis]TDL50927.1 ATPase [Paenibacillus dendritiformis]
MAITFNKLGLVCFKNHKDLTVNFGPITRITGANGEGKSSIGEGITWNLYGVDTFGSKTDPSPTTYEFEQVEAHLLLTVDDKQILLSRVLPKGKTAKYYINEVPKKAKEYEAFVEQLFDKQLFLSLFTPTYFFTQHWEEQRAQLLRYVLPPSNKEVLAELPAPQADKLAALVKKKSLDDLQAQHAENRRKQDKALIAAKSRTKTLEEQLQAMPDIDCIDSTALAEKLRKVDEKLANLKSEQAKARENNSRIERLKTQLQVTLDGANKVREDFQNLKAEPVEDTCTVCGQTLAEEAAAVAAGNKQKQMDELRSRYQMLSDQYTRMQKELAGLEVIDVDELFRQRGEIEAELKALEAQDRLALSIEEAKQDEKEIHSSYTESVFILDAIKAFRAKEAEMMAEKVGGLFETLTLKLFQENKTDGEQKPFFEVEKDGKPYRKLSVGEKIEAGLELISVLSKQSGIVAPCTVDNAESYSSAVSAPGQIILCEVVKRQSLMIETDGE